MYNPYTTSAALFPMSIVAMNNLGLLMKWPMIFEAKTPCFLSSSIFSLLAVMNAISKPLEKAEATSDRIIIISGQ
jgi:hypothetical protein